MNITRLQDHKITINFKWTTPAVFETVSSHGREEEGGRSQKTPPTPCSYAENKILYFEIMYICNSIFGLHFNCFYAAISSYKFSTDF